jgi:hypothetical protein
MDSQTVRREGFNDLHLLYMFHLPSARTGASER